MRLSPVRTETGAYSHEEFVSQVHTCKGDLREVALVLKMTHEEVLDRVECLRQAGVEIDLLLTRE